MLDTHSGDWSTVCFITCSWPWSRPLRLGQCQNLNWCRLPNAIILYICLFSMGIIWASCVTIRWIHDGIKWFILDLGICCQEGIIRHIRSSLEWFPLNGKWCFQKVTPGLSTILAPIHESEQIVTATKLGWCTESPGGFPYSNIVVCSNSPARYGIRSMVFNVRILLWSNLHMITWTRPIYSWSSWGWSIRWKTQKIYCWWVMNRTTMYVRQACVWVIVADILNPVHWGPAHIEWVDLRQMTPNKCLLWDLISGGVAHPVCSKSNIQICYQGAVEFGTTGEIFTNKFTPFAIVYDTWYFIVTNSGLADIVQFSGLISVHNVFQSRIMPFSLLLLMHRALCTNSSHPCVQMIIRIIECSKHILCVLSHFQHRSMHWYNLTKGPWYIVIDCMTVLLRCSKQNAGWYRIQFSRYDNTFDAP